MICRLGGKLEEVGGGRVVLTTEAGMSYEVWVPAYLEEELRQRGQGEVSFHTLHYIEGSPAGGNLLPRLVGFTREEDLRFF
ncbi:MAG: Holliday junction DNA helicase RuvA, partial [Nitrospinota bacterium]